MATTEAAGKISDTVTAALVECVPETPLLRLVPPPMPEDDTPTDQARAASIQPVGAEPPPDEV
jgi:hypothetical protein